MKKLLTYAYIKNIKKWMFCPNCNNDKNKLRLSADKTWWICNKCDYKISAKDFDDDYIFWFCDNCNTFLNIQKGFTESEGSWICEKCNYLNEVGKDNIAGICKYCGIILDNPESTSCSDCRDKQYDKWIRRLNKVPEILDGVDAVIESADRLKNDFEKLTEK